MMQMPGSKTKPDGSVPLVTEDYNDVDDTDAPFRAQKKNSDNHFRHRNDADAQTMQVRISASAKKRRQCSDDVPALKRTVAAFRPWRINSIASHHLNTAFLNGEGGIRTHDTLLRYTRFPIARLRPLGHLSRKQRRRKRDSNP